eukprot:gnl/MRDRNA2_/MRDRNA2_190549_c0_seq1.p1 gnl/MRDRNA2_/MRDRNA2_190549_c0~~gnl/MRDRNA2_/MRDRNA2_190549_c0_seq1.p1  ORF type:complete len:300 (+),score=22.98 gnl/MRDRNA2_/MRDRNA2_190549_c0_seq1:42-902(+)
MTAYNPQALIITIDPSNRLQITSRHIDPDDTESESHCDYTFADEHGEDCPEHMSGLNVSECISIAATKLKLVMHDPLLVESGAYPKGCLAHMDESISYNLGAREGISTDLQKQWHCEQGGYNCKSRWVRVNASHDRTFRFVCKLCTAVVNPLLSPLWGSTIKHFVGDPAGSEVQTKIASLLSVSNATNIFMIEDGHHTKDSVLNNLLTYHHYIKPCGWILIQDTKTTRLNSYLWGVDWTEGPIEAQREFIKRFPEYKVRRRYEYYLYTQHAQGWLQKTSPDRKCSS